MPPEPAHRQGGCPIRPGATGEELRNAANSAAIHSRVRVRLYSHVSVALIASLLMAAPHVHTRAVERSVAITFDDLPGEGAGTVVPDAAGLEALSRKLLIAIRQH